MSDFGLQIGTASTLELPRANPIRNPKFEHGNLKSEFCNFGVS
jgi:hypothetical protein